MPAPSHVETVLFLILLAASAYGFWFRFGKVVRTIRAAKPDPAFSLQPIGKRIWDFFLEVLLQKKVIEQRPLPGIAHAFVFWGFCAFGLVTLNHFAAGVGFPFLSRDGWFGRIYFAWAGVFALCVAVSIAGLFIRRFFVRPIWLGGNVSWESGVIAFLIFNLMITYLATFWMDTKLIWWAHTLTLLVFMPLIPHTKHLHLVLSPATVFLSRGGFSQIPPLVGDEDFGLDAGKDLTRIVALQAYSCVECGRCTEHCPAYNTGKTLNPKEIALGLRRGAVNTGKWEDDYGTKLFLNLERNGNALGFSSTERDKFIAKQEFPIFDGTQEYCLWLGCMGGYDPQGREIVSAFAQVMRHLGTSSGVPRKERCTGDAARRLGNDLAFGQLAEWNLENLSQSKAAKIVSICPHCVRTIGTDWKEYGEAPPIEHHSEFLARHRDKLPQNALSGEKVVYHDPCYLGRYRGVYDEPRQVISQFAEVIDPPRARERSFCCGAGGGLAFLGEEKGERVSMTRAKELAATGATIVGAACPFCNTMFRDALVSLDGPKLMDIAQIAAA